MANKLVKFFDNIISRRLNTPISTRTLNRGGITNPYSGLGGAGDRNENNYFIPNRLIIRDNIQTMYAQSWVAARFVDMPIDDMWIRGRTLSCDDEDLITTFEDAWNKLNVQDALTMAAKAARLYGTGFVVVVSTEAGLDTPLNMTMIKEGDLKNLLVLDRFDTYTINVNQDIYDPGYGKPEMYTFRPRIRSETLDIHPSRLIRFDGRRAPSSEGWSGSYYHQYWGVSDLLCAIAEVTSDAAIFQAMTHLAQEASMLVVKTPSFTDSIMGQEQGPDEPSIADIGEAMNMYKSVFKTIFAGSTDDIERVTVNISGWDKVLANSAERMASIAGIPATRFLSRAPAGMNATGESDMKNYALHVASMQMRMMDEPVRRLDELVLRNIGVVPPEDETPIEYEWLSLFDVGEQENANVAKTIVEALTALFDRGAIDENEIREIISGSPIFGQLDPLAELPSETPAPEPMPNPDPNLNPNPNARGNMPPGPGMENG